MRGQPRLGGRRYLQGFAPTIEFLDCARAIKRGVETTVPFGHFDNVLVTDETSPLDPEGGHQRKFHAPGVGIVRVGAVGDPEAETLVLVRRVHLDRDALAHARQRVLAIDARGRRISTVYRRTPPAEHAEQTLLADQSR
jgi:hypothetical protein